MRKLKFTFKQSKGTFFFISFFIIFILLNTFKSVLFYDIMVFHLASWKNLLFHSVTTLAWVSLIFVSIAFTGSRFLFLFFYSLQMLYLIANLIYFYDFSHYLNFRLSESLLGQSINLLQNNAVNWADKRLLFLPLDMPFAGIIFFRKGDMESIRKIPGIFKASIYGILTIVLAVSYIYRSGHFEVSYAGNTKYIYEYGLLFHQVKGLFSSTAVVEEKYLKKLTPSDKLISSEGSRKRYNVILIQVESMDGGALKMLHHGKPVTGFLLSLSTNSIFYPYVQSFHRGGGTADTEFTVLNSVLPLNNFTALKLDAYDFSNAFVRPLDRNGYFTAAFHGNTGMFWNRIIAFSKMGFSKFYDMFTMKLKESGWGAPDKDVFNYVLKTISHQKQPFFYHIITMTSHNPYDNVLHYYTNKVYDDIQDTKTRNYFLSIAYDDKVISDFIHQLTEMKILTNTFVMIYGDHCPVEYISGYQKSQFVENARDYDFVSLWILTPDHRVYRETSLAVTFLDFAPTVLFASGIPFNYHSDGENLLNPPLKNDLFQDGDLTVSRKHLYLKADSVLNKKYD